MRERHVVAFRGTKDRTNRCDERKERTQKGVAEFLSLLGRNTTRRFLRRSLFSGVLLDGFWDRFPDDFLDYPLDVS